MCNFFKIVDCSEREQDKTKKKKELNGIFYSYRS